jgi:exonuclease VII large subunit
VRRRFAAIDVQPLANRLTDAWDTRAERESLRLQALARQLIAVGPASVLGRGYSYTLRQDGSLLRSPADVRAGDTLLTRLAEGQVRSVVQPDGQSAPSTPTPEEVIQTARPAPRKKRSRPIPPDQMDLFKAPQ